MYMIMMTSNSNRITFQPITNPSYVFKKRCFDMIIYSALPVFCTEYYVNINFR